ncbi:putative DNA-directed RNA polymerase I/III subunit [Pavlovales sp. CCMP2436]|nr:putative DNA-directed RNA polymerase I/III subunit [Pavlovales sp. CCMP2436]
MASNRPDSLPEHLADKHRHVTCAIDAPTYTATPEYAGVYASLGIDNSLDIAQLKQEMTIEVQSLSKDEIVFDIVGIDAPIANALRRILLVEVPTMAIEKVWVLNNTSIVQDEVLAHRLGLIPIRADPALFEERGDSDSNASNTICFRLRAECTRNTDKSTDAAPYIGSHVLSSQLTWVPQGDQATQLVADPPRSVHDDILIAKMRPGQAIEVECWCEKGIGKTHAKWSPVATAYYRLLPRITFHQPVTGAAAVELKKLCPLDVFDIEDVGGVPTATAARPRSCTVCRECVREPQWAERVNLQRVRDHFIFSVESTGAMPPERLVRDALQVLKQKALDTAQLLKDTLAQNEEGVMEEGNDEE